MGTLRSRKALFGACAIFVGSLSVAQLAGWARPDRLVELAALILAAILTSVLAPAAKSRVIMPPSFVVIFGSLLLFDRNLATLVALAAVLSPALATTGRSVQWARLSVDALIAGDAMDGDSRRIPIHLQQRREGIPDQDLAIL